MSGYIKETCHQIVIKSSSQQTGVERFSTSKIEQKIEFVGYRYLFCVSLHYLPKVSLTHASFLVSVCYFIRWFKREQKVVGASYLPKWFGVSSNVEARHKLV